MVTICSSQSRALKKKSRRSRQRLTCILALVNPGSATMVGLQSITYTHIGMGHSRLTGQRARNITHLALVARLLAELSHGGLFGRLALVDEAGGELDAVGVDGRAVLQDDHRLRRLVGVAENRRDGDGVDAASGTGLARGRFPHSVFAVLVGPLRGGEEESVT